MEVVSVISGISGVIAVAEFASKIALQASSLYYRIKRAPSELANLQQTLAILQIELTQIQDLKNEENTALTEVIVESIMVALAFTERAIISLKDECDRLPVHKDGLRSNIKWVFLHRTTIKDLEERLVASENRLSMLLQMISLYINRVQSIFKANGYLDKVI